MTITGIIGEVVVFQVLFLDGANTPVVVPDPTITVFRMDRTTYQKATLVDAAAMTACVPVETGRYVYSYTLPSTLTPGDVVYAEITGTSGGTLRYDVVVLLVSPYALSGMGTQFVTGG